MEQGFEVTLTGSDGMIEGNVTQTGDDASGPVYRFTSVDDTLHLVITRDSSNQWTRIAGTEPYFSGWVDELAEQVESKSI